MRWTATGAALAVCAWALAAAVPARAQAPTPVLAMSFDEMQGSKANDSSPANNDGTITGAQWRTDGRNGGALAFDGDDKVEVPDANSLDLTQLTISAWVRPRTQDRWQSVAIKQQDKEMSYGLYATTPDSNSTFAAYAGSDGIYGDVSLPMNAWSHIAATYDGTYWRLYRNGVYVNVSAGRPPVASTDELQIGNTDIWSDEGLDGLLDDVRIYGTALSEAQIARDRDMPVKSDTEEPVAPVLAMSFDEGAGAIVGDSSTYGNSGVIRGATWTSSGKNGGGLSFDGLDDWVTVNDAASLDLTTAQTVSAWVKIRRNKAWHTIATKELGPSDMAYQLYASAWAATDGPITQLAKTPPDGTYRYATGGGQLAVNRWYHVAYTYDNANIRLYLDGVQVAITPTTGPTPVGAEPLRIGGNLPWAPNEYLDGVLDDLRVYNKVLTLGQVQADKATSVRSLAAPPVAEQEREITASADSDVAASPPVTAPAAATGLAQLPKAAVPARRAAAKKAKPRCRVVRRRVLVRRGAMPKTVVKRVCPKAKKPAKRAAKRRAAKRRR